MRSWSVATGGNTPYHHNNHPAVMPKNTSYRLGDWIVISSAYEADDESMATLADSGCHIGLQ